MKGLGSCSCPTSLSLSLPTRPGVLEEWGEGLSQPQTPSWGLVEGEKRNVGMHWGQCPLAFPSPQLLNGLRFWSARQGQSMLDVEMLLRVAGSYRKTNVCMGAGQGEKQSLPAPGPQAVEEATHCRRCFLWERHMFLLPGIFPGVLSPRFPWRQIYMQTNESWHFWCWLLHLCIDLGHCRYQPIAKP